MAESAQIPEDDGDNSAASLRPIAYTSTIHGFSVIAPGVVTLSQQCPRYQDGLKEYSTSDEHTISPLVLTEIPQGVVLYPQWYMKPMGNMETGDLFSICQKQTINGHSLVQRDVFRDFPYWTILSDTVSSEEGIAESVRRHCSDIALFTGLVPAMQSGVMEVGIDVDMAKSDDSSAIVCPDLLYARYVPSTRRLYYLFNNGMYYIEDPTHEQIQNSLRFITVD